MTNTFFELAEQIDDLINLSQPTQKDLDRLLSLIRSDSYEQYYFKHLANSANPAWFPILREHGFFDKPPAPVQTEGTVMYPRWHALTYLVAIASKLPAEVVEVVENIQIEDAFDMSALVGSFRKIPVVFASRVVPIVLVWLDKQLLVTQELIDLIKYWINNNQWPHALSLIRAILKTQEAPATKEQQQSKYYSPRARFKEYSYLVEEFLKGIPELANISLIETLKVIEDSITQALKIEESKKQYESSSHWRSSIEPSSQNFGDRCKDLLLDTLIRIIDKLHPEEVNEVADRYIRHSLSIFRRLAIHIIRTNKNLWPQYLENLYRDAKYWEDISYYHEYWLLTHDTFYALEPIQQQAYLKRLQEELDAKTNDKEDKQHSRYWAYRRLWAIKDKLPADTKDLFEQLQREFKKPEPEEWFQFLAYSSGIQTGSLSSITSQELAKLTLQEVLAELKKPFPSDLTSFGKPTMDGLANELETAIKENPSQYAPLAPNIFDKEIHPLYVSHLIRGFAAAWKEKRSFDWDPIIKLCDVISQTSEAPVQDGVPPDMEQNYWYDTYSSARKAIVELFWAALADDENAIPHQYLNDVRTILLRLSDDLNPSSEYEQQQTTDGNWTYLDLSLNVTRANAVAALIQYALHRSRIVKNDETAKNLLPQGPKVETSVIEKLTAKLDKRLDPSKAVHVNFGIYLPNLNYLDRKWLLAHLEEIFPRSSEMVDYWQVAWDGYMWRSDFFASLYPDLKPYYGYAIERLGQTIKKEAESAERRLATHLAFLYANGNEPNSNNSLVNRFFIVASDKLRSEFVQTLVPVRIPRSLDSKSIEWARLKTLWQQRYEYIQKQNKSDGYREELGTFLSWVPHVPESLESFEEMIKASAAVANQWQLLHLFEYLAKVVNEHPGFVMSLYEISLHRSDLPHFFVTQREQVQTILEAAIHSNVKEAQESAIRVINFFGERGDESYRDLLKEI